VAVARSAERAIAALGEGVDLLCDIGEQAHVFGNRLEQLRRRRSQEDLKLQPPFAVASYPNRRSCESNLARALTRVSVEG
jgi:hypothetical protein